jgi:glutathionylspermidine synthase
MIQEIRHRYNQNFSTEKYNAFLDDIENTYNHRPPFRIAETPVFLPKDLVHKLVAACDEISEDICQPNFKELTQGSMEQLVPNETDKTLFLQMDFGICKDENGELTPQLIEIQGFPSLYFFQNMVAAKYRQHFDIPENYTHLFHGLTAEDYKDLLTKSILGDHEPQHVAIVEIEPHKQTTQIDFIVTQRELGIPVLCISDLIVEGRDVFYRNDAGQKIQVKRIFNRVIFEDLTNREDLKREFQFSADLNIEYAGHPNWFFRISKYTMPLFDSQYVPKSYFLHELESYPQDLENYVLKPLYSYAGMGVLIDVTAADLDKIENKQHYILQKKVAYAPVIETLDEPSKCEIRMLMLWLPEMEKPKIVTNLARLSKGKMIGVRYNKDKEWVGGSVCFFEK